jgi:hypothetical protein
VVGEEEIPSNFWIDVIAKSNCCILYHLDFNELDINPQKIEECSVTEGSTW